ncbi:alcohol dehydrogenase catalytic domain-containing protein [Halarchaeum acidiphilum]|nr:alcohol dehydrogenase catalytic domain-containing protein [Halarchaeum acidiphilum]
MRAVVAPEEGAAFETRELPIPEPDADEIRIEVEACGVCGGDDAARRGHEYGGGLEYPRVPGHEIVGYVDAVGADVTEWEAGERVGVGWHAGHCFTCEACRRGDFHSCENAEVTGVHRDGGWAEYALASREAVASVPESFDAVEAAPLLCAGLTTFNALRNSDARPGDLVAVQGVGGLGHLGLQYAHEAGFETVALSRGTEKREHALELGADHYVDAEREDPAEALQKLGGASVVLATAPAAPAIESVVGGLTTDGQVVAVGVPEEPVGVHVGQLVGTRGAVEGWASGTALDAEETLDFSGLREITPEVEVFDLGDAEDAYQRMLNSDVRFRAVLTP